MLKSILYLIFSLLITGCSIGKFNTTFIAPKVEKNNVENINKIQKILNNPNVNKYYFAQKQQLLEKLKLVEELEKNKEYEKAKMLKEKILSNAELLSLKADITDMENKKMQYKKDLEIYGNNAILDELDEILKEKSDENSSSGE